MRVKITKHIIPISACILALIFIFLLLQTVLIIKEPSEAMYPTINSEDTIFSFKLSKNIKRGELVVIKNPNNDQYCVRRVIGCPSETVLIKKGKVYINGDLLEEEYLNGLDWSEWIPVNNSYKESISYEIEDNEYFLLGDNRLNSEDSRHFGGVKTEDIISKYMFCLNKKEK